MELRQCTTDRPRLKLFDAANSTPEPGDDQPSGRWPLSRFYRECLRPKMTNKRLQSGTFKAYEQSLSLWSRFTGDPPLEVIAVDFAIGDKFLEGLNTVRNNKGELISNATVRKHVGHIQILLDQAGPRNERHRRNWGLIPLPQKLDAPPATSNPPKSAFTMAELEALLVAAAQMESPDPALTGVSPAAWWQAMILVLYNTGIRIGTAIDLRYAFIEQEDGGPVLNCPDWVMKKRNGRQFPWNEFAAAAVDRLRPASPRQVHHLLKTQTTNWDVIFPWPHAADLGWLQECRRRLCKLAGVRVLGFHAFRRTTGTNKALAAAMKAAQEALGHRDAATTAQSYVNRVQLESVIRGSMPQPALPLANGQGLLFDREEFRRAN